MPHGFHVERSVFGNAEADHSWMNQPSESALPDQTLKSVVRLPVALASATQKLEFDHQAVIRSANDNVEAVQPVQPHGCPCLAGFPTIWTTMELGSIDQPRAVGAVRFARRGAFPRVCMDMNGRKLLMDLVNYGKNKPLLQVALVPEGPRNWIAEQEATQAGLK
jgi:hypothetical protein